MGYPRQTVKTFSGAGSYSFTCPAGVKKVSMEIKGGSTGASNFQRGDVTLSAAIATILQRYDAILSPNTSYTVVVGSGTNGFVRLVWLE